jgi:transposase
MLKRQRFSAEFKREAVRQLRDSGKQVAVLSRELGVPRNRLYKWAEDADSKGSAAFAGSGRKPDDELAKLREKGSESFSKC